MTGTVLLILTLVGAFFCFFGYTLRRIIPAFIGLGFGFSLGVYIRLFIKVGKFGLESADLALSMFGDDIVEAVMKTPDEAFDIIFKLLGSEWLWLPILCAVIFAALGAVFYRTTAAVSTVFSFVTLTNVWFAALNSSNSRLWMLIAALVVFVLVLLLYDFAVIGVSAAYGSFLLSLSARHYLSLSADMSTAALILLLLLGCVLQGVQLARTKK